MNANRTFHTTGVLADPRPEKPLPSQTRNVILLLAACIALMMTGYGIGLPIFGKRLGQLGSGVAVLGLMTMGFAFAQFVLSPFMGSFADRFGRRPLILIALVGEVIANISFLIAWLPALYVIIRLFQGAITAGLLPSSLAVVGDTVPEKHRAQWMGIITGSYGMGFIFGPVIGGFLFDRWGYTAPFTVSACLALLGLLLAIIMVPETRPVSMSASTAQPSVGLVGIFSYWPRPLPQFVTLLLVDFVAIFGLAFIEPQLIFFAYNQLLFTPAQLGILVSGYGLTVLLGQVLLGQLSDKFGRKPLIILGLVLNATLFPGLVFFSQFAVLFVVAMVAGLGNALIAPAVTSSYLDIADEEHRSQVMGMRASVSALGGVIGPLLVTVLSLWLVPRAIFAIAGSVTLAAALVALVVLKRRLVVDGRSAGDALSTL